MSYVPCKKNDASGFTFYVSLIPQSGGETFQANPTLAGGDVKIAIDDAAPANLATLPVVDADFTKRVKVVLSQAETNGDNLTIIFSDAAGDEWCDLLVNIQTSEKQIDDLAEPGDEMALVDDAITSGKFDEATAYPLASADAGATAVARTGADGDTLEDISDQIDGVEADVAVVGAAVAGIGLSIPADIGDVPTSAELDAAHGAGSWEGTTPADIDTLLTTEHGAGSWRQAHVVGIAGGGMLPQELEELLKKLDTIITGLKGKLEAGEFAKAIAELKAALGSAGAVHDGIRREISSLAGTAQGMAKAQAALARRDDINRVLASLVALSEERSGQDIEQRITEGIGKLEEIRASIVSREEIEEIVDRGVAPLLPDDALERKVNDG